MLYLPINHIKAFSKTKPSVPEVTISCFSSFFTVEHKLDNKPDKLNSNVLIHFSELSISPLTWVILDFVGFVADFMGFFFILNLKKKKKKLKNCMIYSEAVNSWSSSLTFGIENCLYTESKEITELGHNPQCLCSHLCRYCLGSHLQQL